LHSKPVTCVYLGFRGRVRSYWGALMTGYAHYNSLASDNDDDDDNDFVVQYLRTFLQTRTLLGNAV
jgi:hypothetical protein